NNNNIIIIDSTNPQKHHTSHRFFEAFSDIDPFGRDRTTRSFTKAHDCDVNDYSHPGHVRSPFICPLATIILCDKLPTQVSIFQMTELTIENKKSDRNND
ncbi:Protein of unknown function, partial [Cotesia congregata]